MMVIRFLKDFIDSIADIFQLIGYFVAGALIVSAILYGFTFLVKLLFA